VLAVFMYTCFYDPGACLAGLLFDETTRSRKDGMIESGIAWVASFFFVSCLYFFAHWLARAACADEAALYRRG
jgi:hypothetical protein